MTISFVAQGVEIDPKTTLVYFRIYISTKDHQFLRWQKGISQLAFRIERHLPKKYQLLDHYKGYSPKSQEL
jgi:hypothetical protein